MPIHDWTRVGAGIFHDFHHSWIGTVSKALNTAALPPDYYALIEPTMPVSPDVVFEPGLDESSPEIAPSGVRASTDPPKVRLTAKTDMEFYRRKQNTVTVRHVSGDRIVAMVEVVSPGNKAARNALRSFVRSEEHTSELQSLRHF